MSMSLHIVSNPFNSDPSDYAVRFASFHSTIIPGGMWQTFRQRFWVLDVTSKHPIRVRIAGKEFVRRPHSVGLYSARVKYSEYTNETHTAQHAWIMFEVRNSKSPLHQWVKPHGYHVFDDRASLVTPFIRRMAMCFQGRGSEFSAWSDFYHLLSLFESAGKFPGSVIRDEEPASGAFPEGLPALVEKVLRDHPGESPTSAQMAQSLGISLSAFSHRYPVEAGETFVQTRTRLRIQRAKELLLAGSAPIKAVAAELGFSDSAHFSRVFTSLVGMPPAKFRREFVARIPRIRGI